MADAPCAIEWCPNGKRPGDRLCSAHRKRLQRGTAMDTELKGYGLPPKDMLLRAAIHLADVSASDDAGWEKAWHRLRVAARRYAGRGETRYSRRSQASYG